MTTTQTNTERPGLKISPGSLLEQISGIRLAGIITEMENATGNRISIILLAQFMNNHQADSGWLQRAPLEDIAGWILEGMRKDAQPGRDLPESLPIPKPGTFLY